VVVVGRVAAIFVSIPWSFCAVWIYGCGGGREGGRQRQRGRAVEREIGTDTHSFLCIVIRLNISRYRDLEVSFLAVRIRMFLCEVVGLVGSMLACLTGDVCICTAVACPLSSCTCQSRLIG
jgi:hypothetical protein